MTCTGLSAFWCPVCGDCVCERLPDGDCSFDGDDCPLHSATSAHADTIDRAQCDQIVETVFAEQGAELTDSDRAELARFAQLLFERSRKTKAVPS